MKSWLNLVVVLGAALLVMASADDGCDIDSPDLTEGRSMNMVLDKLMGCFKNSLTEEMLSHIKESKSLGDFKNFYKEFCPHVSQVTTCMSGVRESLAHCQNKNISLLFMSMSELEEHLLTSGCENDGERLAYSTHGAYLVIKKRDTLVPLRRCFHKAIAFMKLANDGELDLASETYIFYKEAEKLTRCIKHVEDEAYKPAAQWMIDEIRTSMKCKHPEEDRIIPCSEVEVDKLSVSNVCLIAPLNDEHLYDHLEDMTMKGCYGKFFDHDKRESSNHTDIEWLKGDYKAMCLADRELPTCMLKMSAYGEGCLSQEEDKQFQLELQALDDAMKRGCVEDGARMAEIMHHVYAVAPEHGHAIRDCYKSVVEASKAHEGHAISTKNMRFYHDASAFWQCFIGKMHENNEIAHKLEVMMNDVLKKMKCVNPEDGVAVPCESIHEHQH